MEPNILYLGVLPLMSFNALGLLGVQECFTLFPDRDFATQFFPDELNRVESHIQNLLQQRTGGHVRSYEFQREHLTNGRIIVKVTQHVS